MEDPQSPNNALRAENLIMRKGHGKYEITDPFVRDIWREQQALERKL